MVSAMQLRTIDMRKQPKTNNTVTTKMSTSPSVRQKDKKNTKFRQFTECDKCDVVAAVALRFGDKEPIDSIHHPLSKTRQSANERQGIQCDECEECGAIAVVVMEFDCKMECWKCDKMKKKGQRCQNCRSYSCASCVGIGGLR